MADRHGRAVARWCALRSGLVAASPSLGVPSMHPGLSMSTSQAVYQYACVPGPMPSRHLDDPGPRTTDHGWFGTAAAHQISSRPPAIRPGPGRHPREGRVVGEWCSI